MCGEQVTSQDSGKYMAGSPPRVRGTAVWLTGFISFIRITPACAGNSVTVCDCQGLEEDHPRVCGEQRGISMLMGSGRGSPPRVRGTVVLHRAH